MEARNLLRLRPSLRTLVQPSLSRPSTALRSLSTTCRLQADAPVTGAQRDATFSSLGSLGSAFKQDALSSWSKESGSAYGTSSASSLQDEARLLNEEHALHVFSHKHNTHLTLTDPRGKAMISVSAGNLGFRKAQRGSYDAAYQLMAYLINRLVTDNLIGNIRRLEVDFRGFGQGRDAVQKVLLGTEGARLRGAVCRVVDKTRLKIGGTRSPAPRRLG